MAVDYGSRLADLRSRRLGIDRDPHLLIERGSVVENYERRSDTSATRYALGAMSAVNPRYTEISVEECVRIANQLIKGLADKGRSAEFRLQGSVPLNTHIRGVSDVDFLVILGGYFRFDPRGSKVSEYIRTDISTLHEVINLRGQCETILSTKFPAVKVDVHGNKSIRLSGGSLRREIDVVPSSWYNSADYQSLGTEAYRGVSILDKSVPALIDNYPFLHIKRIEDKDNLCGSGVKMAIRMLKNIKNDTDQDIVLSSYEIAALMWHAQNELISTRPGYEMSVLAGTDLHLSRLASNYQATVQLETPDGTRKIIDDPAKFQSLLRLSHETSALADAVLAEGPSVLRNALGLPPASSRSLLSEMFIA